MISVQPNSPNPAIAAAVTELEQMILEHYPDATFEITEGYGDDSSGTYILATVDVDDTDDVFEVVVDRLVNLQVDEGVPVYVLPFRPHRHIPSNGNERI